MKFKTKYILLPFVVLKSLFVAITQVAWGIAGLLLLQILIVYIMVQNNMEPPEEISKVFLTASLFIIEHIMLFVSIFFVLYMYTETKETMKETTQ